MNLRKLGAVVVGGLVLAGCDPAEDAGGDAAAREDVGVETAVVEEAGSSGSADATDAALVGVGDSAAGTGAETTDGMVGVVDEQVRVVDKVDLDPAALENRRVKEEVLKRIDVMPNLSPEDQDRLYVQVDRARAMGKVITIPFGSGESRLGGPGRAALGAALKMGQVAELTADPTVVFVVLGYADRKGDPQKNLAISLDRAQSALTVLRDEFDLMNVMHAVGMGSSEMFDAENLDKNRVVEVWAVLP